MPAVEVNQLRRVFAPSRARAVRRRVEPGRGATVALDGVDLTIAEGEIHGLLGPNGAGKTTLVKILSTVLLPTSGTARVLGYDVVGDTAEVRRRIGIVFGGDRGLYPRLTARQNLRYWASLHRMPDEQARRRVDQVLERVGLRDRAEDRVETFSRGMLQRLHLARGLVAEPDVLFLDEPTTGLDPVAALEFRSLVGELNADGTTILLTTHDMAEAEAVCHRVSLIDRGRLLAVESPRTLGTWLARFERIDVEGADDALLEGVRTLVGVSSVALLPGGAVRIQTDREGVTSLVLKRLVDGGVTSVRTSLPNLEEVYLHLIGERGLEV